MSRLKSRRTFGAALQRALTMTGAIAHSGLHHAAALSPAACAVTVAVGLLVLTAGLARAQQNPSQQNSATEKAQTEAGETLSNAKLQSDIAAGQIPPEQGPPISFAEVLKHPDDAELNYRYAQQQVRAGDVKGAAGTLERILLARPDLARVRLFYAIVLFRLDNLDEAQRELLAVRALPMPQSLRDEVEAYLKQIDLRRQRTRFSASLSLGGQYDSNRDAGPKSSTRLFQDQLLATPSGRHDFAAVAIGSLVFHHDLGYQARHELFGSAVLYDDEQANVKSQSLMASAFEFGGTYRSDLVNISPSVTYSYLRLHNEKLVHTEGLKLRFDRRFGQKTEIYVENHFQHQDFDAVRGTADGVPVALSAPLHTGNQLDSDAGFIYTIDPSNQINLGYTHTVKHAVQKFFAYSGDDLYLRYTWLLGGGRFILTSANIGQQRYEDPDPLVSASTRMDNIFRFRVTYGTPILKLLPALPLPEGLRDLLVTASGEFYTDHSNQVNYTYDSVKAEVLLTKRWEF